MPSAQELHLGEPELARIISETDSALSQMRQLNGNVQSLSSTIYQNSQSDSGRILMNKLGLWSGDYARIEQSLMELNQKAQQVRQVLVSTGQAARDAAGTAG